MHFIQSCRCDDPHCKPIMSPKWYKSFGFKAFDKELLEKEIFESCEDVRLHQFNL
jgi:N-acetylglutamate synthase-like GNAT family acetyltransferase